MDPALYETSGGLWYLMGGAVVAGIISAGIWQFIAIMMARNPLHNHDAVLIRLALMAAFVCLPSLVAGENYGLLAGLGVATVGVLATVGFVLLIRRVTHWSDSEVFRK